MKAVKGFKIYKMGENDWVFAKNPEEATNVMNEMCGEDETKEMLEDVGGRPMVLSQEEFEKGEIHHDSTGETDCIDAPLISYEESLLHTLKTNPTAGHFMAGEL